MPLFLHSGHVDLGGEVHHACGPLFVPSLGGGHQALAAVLSPVTRVCLTCTQTNSSGGTWTPRPGVRGQLTLLPASLAHLPYSVASHHVFAFFLV